MDLALRFFCVCVMCRFISQGKVFYHLITLANIQFLDQDGFGEESYFRIWVVIAEGGKFKRNKKIISFLNYKCTMYIHVSSKNCLWSITFILGPLYGEYCFYIEILVTEENFYSIATTNIYVSMRYRRNVIELMNLFAKDINEFCVNQKILSRPPLN